MRRSRSRLRLGVRRHCRCCGYYTGRFASICHSCDTSLPGIRARILWQVPALSALVITVIHWIRAHQYL